MEFKGTKEGWKFDKLDVYFENKDGLEFIEGNVICCAPSDLKQSMKKWEANAKLIACAPEMLGILIEYKDAFGDLGHNLMEKK